MRAGIYGNPGRRTRKYLFVGTVYLIELNSGGVRSLAWIIGADEDGQAAERGALVARNPGSLKLMPTLSGQSVIMEIHLTMLRRIREGLQGGEYHCSSMDGRPHLEESRPQAGKVPLPSWRRGEPGRSIQ